MAINKKLIHFKEKADFVNEVANNNILDHSIVFIQDSKEISTHGTVYKTVNWSMLKKPDYMKVVALEDGLTVSFTTPLEYSFDRTTWQSLPANTQTPAINKDQYVAFRAKLTPNSSSGIGTFSIDKQCDLKGNCMSLLFGDDCDDKKDLTGYTYAFKKLFYNQSRIKSVDPGFLPATTLTNDCYSSMFQGCTSLTTAPELPATTLAMNCYSSMFQECTSLTTAPELPATTLASSCYSNMFNKCTSLATAPELPATTLASSCYYYMFVNCKKLKKAPKLPATVLEHYCYNEMFSYCSSLTEAPELPATTLANSCYYRMFRGCTNLTTAPELPATTLVSGCYSNMFYGCTSLTTAPELPATTLDSACCHSMFYSCTNLTTAQTILPATTLADDCYQYMFYNCTSLTTAPELPATTLANRCYRHMFHGCKSLTTAPELPAITLSNYCYSGMFFGCTKLNYIKALFTTTPGSSYTGDWVLSVSSTGTFVKSKDATWDVTGNSGIPTNWTIEVA